jgi:tetratricopeptide (TPR) repeat protein
MATTLGAAGFAHQAWRDRQARIAAEQIYQQQLLAEKRQHALEKALAVAMTGDLDAAEKAIGECELLGASAGQVHMLRGQVAFHRGDLMPGIEHLRMAVTLEKESVAAWAMLALLYFDAGQYGECEEILEKVDQLQPLSPEDYLFKGCAEAILDPAHGLRTIDQAISRRNSPIARAMRAQVWAYRAMDTASSRDIGAALDDVRAAKGMLPDNPYVLFVSAFTQLVAASVFAETNDKTARENALNEAGKDVRAIEGGPLSADPVMIRYVYFSQTGAEQKGFELLRDACQRIYSPVILDVLAWDPYRRGDPAKVLEVLNRRKEPELFGDIERACALAELPNGPRRTLEAYQDMTKRYTQGSEPLYCQTVLLLLQRKSDVVAASRALLERHHRLPRLRNTFHKNWLAFNAGRLTAHDFAKAAGDSRLEQCITHHMIGMMRLAEGDREAARAHFRKSVATRYFFNFELDWRGSSRLALPGAGAP